MVRESSRACARNADGHAAAAAKIAAAKMTRRAAASGWKYARGKITIAAVADDEHDYGVLGLFGHFER